MKKKVHKINKIMAVMLIILFAIGGTVPAWADEAQSMTTDSEGKDLIYKTGTNPLWTIESVEILTEPAVGEQFNIAITARNIGSGAGCLPIIQFTEDDKALTNFSVLGGGDIYDPNVQKVESGERYVFNVTLVVSSNAREIGGDGYKLNAILKSYDWNIGQAARTFTTSKQFYVSPKYSLSTPNFVVRNVTFSPAVTDATTKTTATFYVENVSDTKARNVKVSLLGKELNDKGDRNIKVSDLSNSKLIGDIKGGDLFQVSYDLELNAGRKDNEMTMSVDFTGAEKAQEMVVNLPLPLTNAGGKVPRVIINKYTVSPSKAYAGSHVTLNLYVENTNAKEVRNVQISLKVPTNESSNSTVVSSGTVFSPVDSSNTFYIDHIAGKSVAQKEITMYVDSNAAAKTYVVPVSITYESLDGDAYEAEDNVNIPVGQESQIDIITHSVAKEATVGSPVDYSVEFVNAGKVAVTNLKAEIKGDSPVFDNQVYYIGNFDVGATDTFSGSFIPDTAGELSGSIVLSYTTTDNEDVVMEYPFTVNVEEMIVPDVDPNDPGMEPMDPGNNFMDTLKGHIKDIVFIIIIAVLAGIIIRDKRKKKADEELLDE